MKAFLKWGIGLVLISLLGCASIDTGISGIWAENDNGKFIMLNSGGRYYLGNENTIGFDGKYKALENGEIFLWVPDVMAYQFKKITLNHDHSILTIEDMGDKQTRFYRSTIQKQKSTE